MSNVQELWDQSLKNQKDEKVQFQTQYQGLTHHLGLNQNEKASIKSLVDLFLKPIELEGHMRVLQKDADEHSRAMQQALVLIALHPDSIRAATRYLNKISDPQDRMNATEALTAQIQTEFENSDFSLIKKRLEMMTHGHVILKEQEKTMNILDRRLDNFKPELSPQQEQEPYYQIKNASVFYMKKINGIPDVRKGILEIIANPPKIPEPSQEWGVWRNPNTINPEQIREFKLYNR